MKNLDLRRNRTNSKGITLVALVISIVVLLILATVTVQTLTGNNGLLTKAETAVQSNNDSQELEKIKLAVAAAQLAGQGSITTDNLNGELRENFGDNSINVDEKSGGWFLKNNKEYTIFDDGKIQEGNLLLPKEYQQVKYIESSGRQYIDTGVIPNRNLKTELKFKVINNVSSNYLFGSTAGEGRTDYYGLNLYNRNFELYFGTGNDYPKLGELNVGGIYTLIANENMKWFIDGIELKDYTNSSNTLEFSNAKSIWLFTLHHTASTPKCAHIIYYAKMWNNGSLVRNLISCIKKSDNKPGMYDLVNNEFYTNQGTGTFGYGMEDGTYVAPKNN